MSQKLKVKKKLKISETNVKKFIKQWANLRRRRVNYEIRLLNYTFPYSYATQKFFFDFLTAISQNDFDKAIEIFRKLNLWAEEWLKELWMGMEDIYTIDNIFSDKDWKSLQSMLLTVIEDYIIEFENLLGTEKSELRFIYFGIISILKKIKSQGKTFRSFFKEDIRKTTQIYTQIINEMGEITCHSLYGEICSGIPRWGERVETVSDQNDISGDLIRKLWDYLKLEDIDNGFKTSLELIETGKEKSLNYAKRISELQLIRTKTTDSKEKELLLKKEFEKTRLMKEYGLYYAIGLYFSNLFELGKKGNNKLIEDEFTQAKNLSFISPEDVKEVKISNLLRNPDDFDGKLVKIEGIIQNLKEKKLKGGKGELVFTTFEVHSDDSFVEIYYPRYWLSDNGLRNEGYGVFSGIFNKLCKQAKSPDIHLTQLSFGDRRDKDWINRCKWIIRDWWDGFTDRSAAEWTLGTLNPEASSFETNPDTEAKLTEDIFDALKEKYPSLTATLRSFRNVIFKVILRNFTSDYKASIHSHYDRNTMIDALLYKIITSFLTSGTKLSISRIKWQKKTPPWFDNGTQKENFVCDEESKIFNLGKELNWLNYELEFKREGGK